MKKLLQINSVVNTSSTGRIAEEIGKLAIANGWESHIAYGRYGNKSESKVIKIGKKIDNYLHVFETRFFDNHGFSSDKATKKFIKEIERISPDIIHLHNIHGYYLNVKILFKYLSNKTIPVVWTLHDCWPFTGHCSYFTMANCEKWKTECNHCPQKTKYPTSFLLDRSRKNFNTKKEIFNSLPNLTLIPVSNWLNSLLKKSFLKNIDSKVIHNGLDLTKFRVDNENDIKEELGLKDHFIILGVANPWSKRKGLKDMIKLNDQLEKDMKLVLVGLNDKQLKKMPKDIIALKKTDSMERLIQLYSAADVYLNLTYDDNFPTTNIEALACGTPVITYNTGGSPEAINPETGFVVEQGDLEGLLEKIQLIKKNTKVHFSEACKQRVATLFNKDVKYMEYLTLYNDLLMQKP